MGPTSIHAPGFLGYLQLKDRGKNPVEIGESIQPTVDMRDWLFQAQARFIGPYANSMADGAFGFQGLSSPSPLVVPPREFWYVHHYTCYVELPLGDDAIHFWPGIANPSTGTLLVIGDAANYTTVAGPARWAYAHAHDLWLPPDTQLGFVIGQLASGTTGAILGAATMRVTSLPI